MLLLPKKPTQICKKKQEHIIPPHFSSLLNHDCLEGSDLSRDATKEEEKGDSHPNEQP
jgi:hypothetical protein